MEMKVEIGVRHLQSKGHQGLPATTRSWGSMEQMLPQGPRFSLSNQPCSGPLAPEAGPTPPLHLLSIIW